MIRIEATRKLFAFRFSDCSGHVIHASADVANPTQVADCRRWLEATR